MNLSVWRDVRSQNGGRSRSRDVIVGLHDGNRIWRVSPDSDGQIITSTIVCPILFTGSMNSLNPYHVTQCDHSVAHIIWYTVTCLPGYHDTLSAGHPGQLKTQELVQQDYWWPGLATFVKNYVKGCALCQHHKINPHLMNPCSNQSQQRTPDHSPSSPWILSLISQSPMGSILSWSW